MSFFKKTCLELYFKYHIPLFLERANKHRHTTPFPEHVFVELTRNCNGYCRMCSRKKQNYTTDLDMPFDIFKKIADTLFLHAKSVDLRGFGESTLLTNWLEYVNYALKYDCRLGIITNLNKRDDKMWEHLAKNNFWIGVSFDGATKQTFNYIRRGNEFDNVVHNLQHLVKCFKKYNRDVKDLYLVTTVQKNNLLELPKIILFASKLGLKLVEFNPVRTSETDKNNIYFHQEEMRRILSRCVKLADKNNINLVLLGSLGQKSLEQQIGYPGTTSCKRPWSHAYITYDGRVGPCNHLLDPPLFFGTLKEESFQDIWDNWLFNSLRDVINTKDRPFFCKWCEKNRYD